MLLRIIFVALLTSVCYAEDLAKYNGQLVSYQGKLAYCAPWTPAALGTNLAAWYDAADASTISEVGGLVSQWNDKSGKGRNATQGTGANQPAIGSVTIGGLNTISFDGVNDWMGADSVALAIGSQPFTIYTVNKSPTTGDVLISMRERNGLIRRGYFRRDAVNTVSTEWGNPSTTAPMTTIIDGSENIIGYELKTSGKVENYLNGVAQGEVTPLLENSYGDFTIGAFTDGTTAHSNVAFGEILIISNDGSVDIRQKIEGYLAWKWGLEANLPTNHPYYASPPLQ